MIYIGTSGYSYGYWRGRFYPEGLPASEWLPYYAMHFNTVELNGSFYSFPNVSALQRAVAVTPEDFLFSVKAHKIITHTRRMRDVKTKIREFMDIIHAGLGKKLANVLYQLPPSYSYTPERLEDILEALPPHPGTVVEFRHISWWQELVWTALRARQISFCNVSFPNLPDTGICTSSVFYKRMHGVPQLFESVYSREEVDLLYGQLSAAANVFVYFNNTSFEGGYTNAGYLSHLVE